MELDFDVVHETLEKGLIWEGAAYWPTTLLKVRETLRKSLSRADGLLRSSSYGEGHLT